MKSYGRHLQPVSNSSHLSMSQRSRRTRTSAEFGSTSPQNHKFSGKDSINQQVLDYEENKMDVAFA